MLVETLAGELRLALEKVKPAISHGRHTIPILSSVLIKGGAVTATNLDMEISVKVAASRFEGGAAIPYRPLAALVKALPIDTKIRMSALDRSGSFGVSITFSGGRYFLPSFDAVDFPDWIAGTNSGKASLDTNFLTALKACRPAISTEETRYYLNGVCFSKDSDGSSVIVATDGHRLIGYKYDHDTEGDLILPSDMISALLQLPPPTEVLYSDTQMDFRLPGGRLRCKLIDATYPDWRRVVPKIHPSGSPKLIFNPLKMAAVLRRIQIGSKEPGIGIDITADAKGELVIVSHRSRDNEEAAERIEGASARDWSVLQNRIISFNAKYLASLCQVYRQAEEVTLETNLTGAPSLVRCSDSKLFAVLMPMLTRPGIAAVSLLALSSPDNDQVAYDKVANGGAA